MKLFEYNFNDKILVYIRQLMACGVVQRYYLTILVWTQINKGNSSYQNLPREN